MDRAARETPPDWSGTAGWRATSWVGSHNSRNSQPFWNTPGNGRQAAAAAGSDVQAPLVPHASGSQIFFRVFAIPLRIEITNRESTKTRKRENGRKELTTAEWHVPEGLRRAWFPFGVRICESRSVWVKKWPAGKPAPRGA